MKDETTRWNLFSANVQTQESLLYGKTPSVSVERRFTDANDDLARVGGELLERLLNTDIERDSDSFQAATGYALKDLHLAGLGVIKLRYSADIKEREVPPKLDSNGKELAKGFREDVRENEDVETDYIYWKDNLWSPARTFNEIRWWAFRAEMTRKQLKKRFPKYAKDIPLNSKREARGTELDANKTDPWARADIWEIWCKEDRKRYYFVEGYTKILEATEDPYGLSGFWPFPQPLVANLSTSKYIPTPDFVLAQDLYNELDSVSTRITRIERALKVAGVYDKTAGESVGRLVKEAGPNELIPIENWAQFAEKGGIDGAIDWFPLEDIVAALDKLRDYRAELIQAIFQITGYSDLLRGQQEENGTPGEAGVKIKFASVRLQAKQDGFANFVSQAQRIRAEMISKFFQPQTIFQRSNAQYMQAEEQLKIQALQFIKDKLNIFRIVVKPENINLTDFAAQKAERAEVLQTMTGFIQAAAPMAQFLPGSIPFLLELMKWMMAGVKGGSTAEGIFDEAILSAKQGLAQAAQNPQGGQVDPKLLAVQAHGQMDLQKIQAQTQSELVKINAETAAIKDRREHDAQIGIAEERAKHAIRLAAPLQKGSQGEGESGKGYGNYR